ncbi:copper chaperone PCu(A)C [Paracoccus sp. Z118]|uniref:copper chaperone PCu(A)C n=1 Tax=Paracoccus sp. Z118 TaxID=2851017 RepID=UPI001C2BF616|nr:copper chaperone PCu(A)C [Paracoccus sp. Z118]MBV0890298.1 copper chaperone PCu(A)C [Paracoccus sp. Z118]
MKTLISAALLALTPIAALAEAPGITASDAYARSANPRSGAAFMTIENANANDCVLSAVASDVTERAELHTHQETDGVMKMTPVESVTIPAGGSHPLARGADHIMLMALETPLNDGDTVNITLDLGDCGTLPVAAVVDNARQPDAAAGGHAHGHAAH